MFSTLTDCINFLNDVSQYQRTLKITPEEFYLIYQIAMYPFVKKPFQPQNPSLAEIARRCGRSQETVHGYKKSLLKKGLLKYSNHYKEGRGQIENSYSLSPIQKRIEKLKAIETETENLSREVSFTPIPPVFQHPLSGKQGEETPPSQESMMGVVEEIPSSVFSPGIVPEKEVDHTQFADNAGLQGIKPTETDRLQKASPLGKNRDYNTFSQSFNDVDLDTVSEISKIMSRAGVLASPMAVEIVTRFAYDFSLDMIDYAFRKATIIGQAQNLTYVAGIFNSWRKKGISTVQQALSESKYENSKKKSTKARDLLSVFYHNQDSFFAIGYSDSFYEQLKKLAGIEVEKEMVV